MSTATRIAIASAMGAALGLGSLALLFFAGYAAVRSEFASEVATRENRERR